MSRKLKRLKDGLPENSHHESEKSCYKEDKEFVPMKLLSEVNVLRNFRKTIS